MPIDGRYLGPMFRYHFHGRLAVETLLSAKDYLCYLLTGERLTDPSTAAGYGAFDLAAGAFDASLAGRWGTARSALPAVRPAHALAGPLSAEGARLLGLRAGVPVTVGSADSVASGFAMCGLQKGVVCITMGSSTVVLDAIAERALDRAARYLLTPHVAAGWYAREMDLLATGTGYAWLSRLLGWADGELDQQAADSEPGARGVRFAPYLAGGEQGALWDATLRGSIHGLTVRHRACDLARAFLEGMCFEIRRCVDVLAERGVLHGVVVAGHIINRPTSLRLLADILGRPLRPWHGASPAARGAALGARLLLEPDSTLIEESHAGEPAAIAPGADGGLYDGLYQQYAARSWR
jgi:xylulokinase